METDRGELGNSDRPHKGEYGWRCVECDGGVPAPWVHPVDADSCVAQELPGGSMNKAAQELGRLGKGKPKTLTQAERKRRAQRLAKARLRRWATKGDDQ